MNTARISECSFLQAKNIWMLEQLRTHIFVAVMNAKLKAQSTDANIKQHNNKHTSIPHRHTQFYIFSILGWWHLDVTWSSTYTYTHPIHIPTSAACWVRTLRCRWSELVIASVPMDGLLMATRMGSSKLPMMVPLANRSRSCVLWALVCSSVMDDTTLADSHSSSNV